jgi:hypothetical protein
VQDLPAQPACRWQQQWQLCVLPVLQAVQAPPLPSQATQAPPPPPWQQQQQQQWLQHEEEEEVEVEAALQEEEWALASAPWLQEQAPLAALSWA